MLIQKHKERDKQNLIWLKAVKIQRNRPKKLFKKIKNNLNIIKLKVVN